MTSGRSWHMSRICYSSHSNSMAISASAGSSLSAGATTSAASSSARTFGDVLVVFSSEPRYLANMTQRAGTADLPLHNGRVPRWLGERMARLGAVMTEAIVHHYGRDEFLRRVANPFWFQSFGAV